MNTESRIVLPDGRGLAYAEFGAHGGRPVLYFHGSPSSRLEPLLVGDEVWTRHGLRVIAPDRPGMGRSDFQPGRGFSHWPADVAALADDLGLERFAVLGNSGGASSRRSPPGGSRPTRASRTSRHSATARTTSPARS